MTQLKSLLHEPRIWRNEIEFEWQFAVANLNAFNINLNYQIQKLSGKTYFVVVRNSFIISVVVLSVLLSSLLWILLLTLIIVIIIIITDLPRYFYLAFQGSWWSL